MRTAICISGQPREVEETWRSWSNVLDHLPNPDVFIYTSEQFSVSKDFFTVLQPKAYVVESQVRFPDLEALVRSIGYCGNDHINSYLQQIYGWKKVLGLKQSYETDFRYDFVVRTRPDLIFLKPITQDMLVLDKINTLRTPEALSITSEFAIGPNDQMELYLNVFDWLRENGVQKLTRDNPRTVPAVNRLYDPDSILATYLLDDMGLTLPPTKLPEDYPNRYYFFQIMSRHKKNLYQIEGEIK